MSRYTLEDLKKEDWYKSLPDSVKATVLEYPPVLLYRRLYSSGFWMVTGFTEDNPPNLILQRRELAGKASYKSDAAIVSPSDITPICWSCRERTSKEELLTNDSWCESCNKNSKEKDG
jgi:hypothetical protein